MNPSRRFLIPVVLFLTLAIVPRMALPCTNFAASINGRVLFGNSEDADWTHPLGGGPQDAVVWFYPAHSPTFGDGYGCIALGWFWNGTGLSFQGGTNDQGLSFDSTAIPDIKLHPSPDRPLDPEKDWFWGNLLRTCATVDDAVALAEQYDWGQMWFQIFVSDASGDAAVIGPGKDGELFVVRKDPGDGYLVQTNFNRLYPEIHFEVYPCPRYETAMRLLGQASDAGEISMATFTEILRQVRRTGGTVYTPYSNIVDPVNKVMYVYYVSQFDDPLVLQMDEELAKGERWAYLRDLVSEDARIAGDAAYTQHLWKRGLFIGGAILGLVALGKLMVDLLF